MPNRQHPLDPTQLTCALPTSSNIYYRIRHSSSPVHVPAARLHLTVVSVIAIVDDGVVDDIRFDFYRRMLLGGKSGAQFGQIPTGKGMVVLVLQAFPLVDKVLFGLDEGNFFARMTVRGVLAVIVVRMNFRMVKRLLVLHKGQVWDVVISEHVVVLRLDGGVILILSLVVRLHVMVLSFYLRRHAECLGTPRGFFSVSTSCQREADSTEYSHARHDVGDGY